MDKIIYVEPYFSYFYMPIVAYCGLYFERKKTLWRESYLFIFTFNTRKIITTSLNAFYSFYYIPDLRARAPSTLRLREVYTGPTAHSMRSPVSINYDDNYRQIYLGWPMELSSLFNLNLINTQWVRSTIVYYIVHR